MTDIRTALGEYAAIVQGVAKEYADRASVEQIRLDHPELDFMDDDEIEEIIQRAKLCRTAHVPA